MSLIPWRRWLGQTAGKQARVQQPYRRRPAPVAWKPLFEELENRIQPAVTSNVASGILTITGDFNDTMFVASQGGQVKINGQDPGSGAALASSIIQIQVNPGAGYNTVDLRNVLPAQFTSLVNMVVNGGQGQDTYKVNPLIPATIDSGNQPTLLIFEGSATDVTENLITDRVLIDGIQFNIPGPLGNVRLDLNMQNFTLIPGADNHRILADNSTPNDGVSRAFNADDGSFSDFKNPTGTLTIRNLSGVGGSTFEFNGLDALRKPAQVVLDANNQADTLVFSGTATNVIANYVTDKVFLDGQIVSIPNSANTNVAFTAQMVNFTFQPGAGNHRILRDNGVAGDGISRAFNADDSSFTDFRNPSGKLLLQDITGAGGSTYEFETLDAVGRPGQIVMDSGSSANLEVINVGGAVGSVVANLAAGTVTAGGFTIGLPGANSNLLLDMNMANLTIQPGAGNHRIIRDDNVVANGISRALNADDGSFTDFRNPTSKLVIQDVNNDTSSIYEFETLDTVGRPGTIILDSGTNANLEIVNVPGTAANVEVDLASGLVTVDGLTLSLPGLNSSLLLDMNMTNLVLQPGAGNHRVLQDDGVAGNGISRALNANNGSFTDFRNPTATLTLEDINPGGVSTYEFRTLDTVGRPGTITLDSGTNANLEIIRVPGSVGTVTAALANGTVNVDGLVINVPGSNSSLLLDMNMTNLVLQPGAANHRILMDNGVANDGISRASNNQDGSFTDFRNPSGSLTVVDVNAAPGSIYEFQTLDAVRRPANITLDTGAAAGIQRFTGKATNVIEDLSNDTMTIDGLRVNIPGAAGNLQMYLSSVNFTLIVGAANHRIIQDNGIANDGISRALNNLDGTFSDFINPTGRLTVLASSGNTTLEMRGLDVVHQPAAVDLRGAAGNDTIIVNFASGLDLPDLIYVSGGAGTDTLRAPGLPTAKRVVTQRNGVRTLSFRQTLVSLARNAIESIKFN